MISNPDSDSGKSNAPQIDKFIGEKQYTAFSEIPGCTFERGINKLSQLASPIGYSNKTKDFLVAKTNNNAESLTISLN